MATMQKGLLCLRWQPRITFVRFRKVNIQKPFPPHFTRAKVEEVCKPYFAKTKKTDPLTPLDEICTVGVKYFQQEKIVNPYAVLVGKEMLNWFNHSRLIAFFHLNPITAHDMLEFRLAMKKLQMKVKVHGKEIMTHAVEGTKFEPVLAFYQSRTIVAFGPEPDVKGMLNCLKSYRKINLLGAVVDDRLMSVAELDYYAAIPDLQAARIGLVSVLNVAAQNLVRQLNQSQSTLVQHLQSHIDIQSKKDPS